MPKTVELQDGTELEFPDGMDEMAMRQAISKNFPQFAKPLPSESAAIPEPGQSQPGAFRRPPASPLTQAFPAVEQQRDDALLQQEQRIARMPQAIEEAKFAPPPGPEPEIQPIGEPGSVLRGVTSVAAGILNRPEYLVALSNPATAAAVTAYFVPSVAKHFVEDVQLANKGDKEALGRAAAIAMPILGGIALKGGARAIGKAMDETAMQRVEGTMIDQAARESVSPITREASSLLKRSDAELESFRTGTDPTTLQTVKAPDRGETRAMRKQQAPVVPETLPEPQRGLTVLDEIRQAGADTTAKVQKLYPHLKREEAAALRRQAFPAERTSDAIPKREAEALPVEEPPGNRPQVDEQVRQQTRGDDAAAEAPATPPGRDVGKQPFEYVGEQDYFKGMEPEMVEKMKAAGVKNTQLFNLTEDVPGVGPKGSTISLETLQQAGFKPEVPKAAAPSTETGLSKALFNVPKERLQQAVDAYAKKHAGAGGTRFEKTLRQNAGKKAWEDMTPQERFEEFKQSAEANFEEMQAVSPENRRAYMEDRAMDFMDPMNGVFKILLELEGYEFRGHSMKPPAGVKRQIPEPAGPEFVIDIDLPEYNPKDPAAVKQYQAAVAAAKAKAIKQSGMKEGELSIGGFVGGRATKGYWRKPRPEQEPAYLKEVEAYRAKKEAELEGTATAPKELPPEAPKKATLSEEEQAAARADLAKELGDETPAEPANAGLFTPEALQTPAARTAGLKPPSSDPMAIVHQLRDFTRKHFTVRGHLPEEVMELKRKMDASGAAAENAIKMGERDLMAALKDVYKLSELEIAGGGSRRIPADAVRLMDAYLKGRVANPTAIPPRIRGVLDSMRAEIDGQSNKIIAMLDRQRAALRPGTAQHKALSDLIDKIRNNLDIYVHRSYKYFDSEKSAPQWYADLNPAVRQVAEDYVTNHSPVPLSRAEAQSKLLDWLSDLKPTEKGEGSAQLGSKDLSIFMRRNVIAPEIRAVLGEYHNPLVNYAKSMSKMADWVAKQTFLNEVRRTGMGRFLFEEGMNPPGFNAKIAAKGSETLSPLNGLRTTQEIADAFKQLDAVTDHGLLARTYLTLNAWSKFAATGLSVMTQARNLASRPFMAGMAGHWQVGQLRPAVRAIYEDFAGSDKTWRAYLKNAYEHGVIGDTARAGELKAIIKDAALRDVSPSELYSWSMAKAVKKYGYKIPAEIYRLSDELGNIFGWENEKALQRKIHPTWTNKQIEAEAAKIVRDIYPTYSETPRAIQQFRKVAVVGPFVTFPYQMFRTTWNGISRSFHEIRSSNPAERQVGYQRLASQLATVTATYAMQELGKALLGLTTQQEDDFRRFQPPWSRNAKFMFLSKDPEKGELNAINLSYLDPYSYLTDPLIAIASNARSDKPLFEVFAETSKEMFRPWISEQMLAKAIIEARNGKTDSGREIYNPTDSPMEKFQKQSDHVLTVLKPGTLQRVERRILPAIRNEQPVYGRKLEVGPEIARELTGMAVEKFSFRNGLAYRAREFVDKDKAAEGIFHDTLSRTQTTTSEDLLNAYKKSDERRFEAWKELRKDFLATVRQGVSLPDARNLLVARGVSRMDAAAIAAGRYMAMPISQQALRRSIERKRQMPIQGIAAYQREANQRSLD